MSAVQLTSGAPYLVEKASTFFRNHYGGVQIASPGAIKGVSWSPSLGFVINTHHTICGEASEDRVYPEVLRLRNADILAVHEPISVYAITTDEVYLRTTEQADVRELAKHGYGLVTVSADGSVQRRIQAQPLVQHISQQDYLANIVGLPSRLKQHTSAAFDTYAVTPPSGVAQLSEVIEGMVTRAFKDGLKRGFVQSAMPNTTAATLDALIASPQLGAARPALGGARAFYSEFRNLTHHFPRSKAKAYKKYCDCRHGFIEGLHRVSTLRESLRNVGLSGLL